MSDHTSCPVFTCILCQKPFARKYNLFRHQETCFSAPVNPFSCHKCSKEFNRYDNLQKHLSRFHVENFKCSACLCQFENQAQLNKHVSLCDIPLFKCDKCDKRYTSQKYLQWHVRRFHPTPICCTHCAFTSTSKSKLYQHVKRYHEQQTGGGKGRGKGKGKARDRTRTTNRHQVIDAFSPNQSSPLPDGCSRQSFNGETREFDYTPNGDEGVDLLMYLASVQSSIVNHLQNEIIEKGAVKWSLCVQVKFSKVGADGVLEFTEPYFHTSMIVAARSDDLIDQYNENTNTLLRRLDDYEGESSTLNFEEVMSVKLTVVRYRPFTGSSYLPLPEELKHRKKCVLNIENDDDDCCFLYSVIAHLYPAPASSHRERVYHYLPHVDKINVNGITFPLSLKQIPKFELQNNVTINVYGYEEPDEVSETDKGVIYPVCISKSERNVPSDRCIDLLLITDENKSHYCLITNLSALVKNSKGDRNRFVCRRCLWPFTSQERLEKHKDYCYHKAQRITMPEEGDNFFEFGLYQKSFTQRIDFVFYADFESVLEKENNENHTSRFQKHVPCGFAYNLVSRVPQYSKPLQVYSGKDAAAKFVNSILDDYEWIQSIYDEPVPMKLTVLDRADIESTTECYLCGEEMEYDRHLDHDHLTGAFRGVCHSMCNVNYKQQRRVVCVLHNSEHYDTHLILQAVEEFEDRQLKCIPRNTENFMTFSMDNLIFIDSFKFLSSSLQKLTENLKDKSPAHFVHLRRQYPNHADLLTRKLPFCYEYLDSFEKLNDTELPSRDEFYSSLNDEHVSEEDYEFVQQLWDTFHIQTLNEFMKLYVSVDTLILCDVMENFRDMCLSDYKLEPFHFLSLPGFSMMSCLQLTGVQLELFTHPDYYSFIERGIRGGVSMVCKRYSKANNKYMPDYDPTQDTNYILYYDVNSLYATCMTQPLPVGDFQFLNPNEFATIDWMSIPFDSSHGFIVECDLKVDRELHDFFASFPLAPMHENIPAAEFSPYCKQLLKQLGLSVKKPSGKKLFCTLKDKNNYIIHYETLKFYLRMGLKLTHVHKVMRFTQSAWMKPYVDFNIRKRQEATDNASRDLFKLACNSCFGKTIENVRKYKKVELVTDANRLLKYTSKCNFKTLNIFSENLVAVEMEQVTIKLSKPIIVGLSVLNLAKKHIYSFYYDVLVRQYQKHVTLLMTDTDSLLVEIRALSCQSLLDPYEFMLQNLHLFDTSNYPPNHPLFSQLHRKEAGVMKDESAGKIIREFIGLKAKNYSFQTEMKKGELVEQKTAKGVKRAWVKKHLRHSMFKECLFDRKQFWATFNLIHSFHNTLYTVNTKKVALSPLDNKRYLLDDGIHSLPYGYNHQN